MDEPVFPINETMYMGIIGSFLYLTARRPDIVFSIGLYARFQSSPKESHLKAAKRILRYLKGTQDLVLYYPSGDNFDLIGCVDSDYVGYLVDRMNCGSLLCHKTSAFNIEKNSVQHKRAKHIDVRHYFLRDNGKMTHLYEVLQNRGPGSRYLHQSTEQRAF
ncbi:secreted RxLR effector protein 161-like [Nicotiana tomentosiformis]|uniref:secreted RxLR effector protein 161-like n=1 Tax=Nicotiana tomentosiformis TaxID=4098 RepID=UPI00388CC530